MQGFLGVKAQLKLMHPPPHHNFPVSSLSINYSKMYTQSSTDCHIRASSPTAQFSQCTYSTASAPFCLCCSLIDGKMSHSLPLITSPELMSPTLNILPPSLYISLSVLHPSLSRSHKGTLQFHLKWCWSHFRKMLEALCSRNTMVIHHISGRTVYQLSETTGPVQCCENALLIVSDC